MAGIISWILRLTVQSEEAASLVEYALLLLLLVVVTLATIGALGVSISNMFNSFAPIIP